MCFNGIVLWRDARDSLGVGGMIWDWVSKFKRGSSLLLLKSERAEANFARIVVVQFGDDTDKSRRMFQFSRAPNQGGGGSPDSSSQSFLRWTSLCSWMLSNPGCKLSFKVFGGSPGSGWCFEARPCHHLCHVKARQWRDLSTGVRCLGSAFWTGRKRALLFHGLWCIGQTRTAPEELFEWGA